MHFKQQKKLTVYVVLLVKFLQSSLVLVLHNILYSRTPKSPLSWLKSQSRPTIS